MRQLFLCLGVWVLVTSFSGCVVREDGYHHHHHDRVYIEERPVVEERVEVR